MKPAQNCTLRSGDDVTRYRLCSGLGTKSSVLTGRNLFVPGCMFKDGVRHFNVLGFLPRAYARAMPKLFRHRYYQEVHNVLAPMQAGSAQVLRCRKSFGSRPKGPKRENLSSDPSASHKASACGRGRKSEQSERFGGEGFCRLESATKPCQPVKEINALVAGLTLDSFS